MMREREGVKEKKIQTNWTFIHVKIEKEQAKKNNFNIVSRKIDNSCDGGRVQSLTILTAVAATASILFFHINSRREMAFFLFSLQLSPQSHHWMIVWCNKNTCKSSLSHIYISDSFARAHTSFTRSHRIFSVTYVTVLMRPSPLTTLKRNSTKVYEMRGHTHTRINTFENRKKSHAVLFLFCCGR